MLPATLSEGGLITGAAYAAKAGRAGLRDPREGVLRVADVLADRRDRLIRDERHPGCGRRVPCAPGVAYSDVDTLPAIVPRYSPVARFATPLVFAVPVLPAKRPVPPVI
jgi:hypothetical protein